jgi:hypothetical protein
MAGWYAPEGLRHTASPDQGLRQLLVMLVLRRNRTMKAGYVFAFVVLLVAASPVAAGQNGKDAEVHGATPAGDVLLVPDSANKRLMLFSAETGMLIDDNFIELELEETGTPFHALLSRAGEVLVSDQTRHVVHRYTLAGDYLGVFAPAGGQDTTILQGIRGMALKPDGHLLVTVGAGLNSHAVVEFDLAGNPLGNFIDNSAGDLDSPFSLLLRPGMDWLVSSEGTGSVKRYDPDTGVYLGEFADVDNFPQQVRATDSGNVLITSFSGTPGVHEFDPDGDLVRVVQVPGLNNYRGVFELGNGNLLVSTFGGVFQVNRSDELLDTHWQGDARFIEPVNLGDPGLVLDYTVGTTAAECAPATEITVAAGAMVTTCFRVTNNTGIELTRHDLFDSGQGLLFDDLNDVLAVDQSLVVTETIPVQQVSIFTATWTAFNPGPEDVFSAIASAVVNVVEPAIELSVTVGTDDGECGEESTIEVLPGTLVTWCYTVTNTSLTTFELHDLIDSELGSIHDGLAANLEPDETLSVTQTVQIFSPVTSQATWTAFNAGPSDVAEATDSASVTVPPLIFQNRFEP